jgi:hypothetical protein
MSDDTTALYTAKMKVIRSPLHGLRLRCVNVEWVVVMDTYGKANNPSGVNMDDRWW